MSYEISNKFSRRASPIIVGELCEEDISSQWYIIAKDVEDNYITIDLAKERLGMCYDSYWDRHGVVGECSVVTKDFTELISQLLKNDGESLYDYTFLDNSNGKQTGEYHTSENSSS